MSTMIAETKSGMISVETAAQMIGCSDAHVRRLLGSGKLKGEQLEGTGYWLVYKSAAEAFAKIPQKTGRPRGS